MSSDASLALQTAIYSKLTGTASLMALVTGVFDFAPQNQALPFVQIGDDTMVDWGTKSNPGQEATLVIHTWAQGAGRKSVKTIMAKISEVLDRATLSMSGFNMVLMHLEFSHTEVDDDGYTHHGIQRFRALIEKT